MVIITSLYALVNMKRTTYMKKTFLILLTSLQEGISNEMKME